jgi:hypothetical protein
MGNALFLTLIETLNQISPLWIVGMEFFAAYGAVLLLFRFFGKEGLFVYVTMAIILANIQVLKVVSFPILPDPIALGTVVFVSTYLAIEIVNEHFGKKEALKLVSLSFLGYFTFMVLMMLALSFCPLTAAQVIANGSDVEAFSFAYPMQEHLMAIFSPAPSIFISSLLAFASSQTINVHVFSRLKSLMKGRFLWVRGVVSSSISTLTDNLVFSVFAFIILAKEPIGWDVVMHSYVLGIFIIRLTLAVFDTPMLYLSYVFRPKDLAAAPMPAAFVKKT